MIPVWIEEREALALHGRLLALHGGATGLRDYALLESALARRGPRCGSNLNFFSRYRRAFGLVGYPDIIDHNNRARSIERDLEGVPLGPGFPGLASGLVKE